MGVGELAMPLRGVGTGVLPSPLSPLFSLMALLSSLSFESLEPVESLLTSSEKPAEREGAFHEGTCHKTPVNDLTLKPFFSHFRHLNFPVRSRARRFWLMAPMLAFGPSFWAGAELGKGPLLFGSLIMSPLRYCQRVRSLGYDVGKGMMMERNRGHGHGPSPATRSLLRDCLECRFAMLKQVLLAGVTYRFFFLLGPGLPRCFGSEPFVPSITAADRFEPGFGPLRFGPGGASDDGVLVPFMAAVESAGVSAGVGSTI